MGGGRCTGRGLAACGGGGRVLGSGGVGVSVGVGERVAGVVRRGRGFRGGGVGSG